jgi:putative transposase
VAIGISAFDNREVLGFLVDNSEPEGFWRQFLGPLQERGLHVTLLMMSDGQLGLTPAIKLILQGCSWCRTDWSAGRTLMPGVMSTQPAQPCAESRPGYAGRSHKPVIVIFAPVQVHAHWQRVTRMLRKHFPSAVPDHGNFSR